MRNLLIVFGILLALALLSACSQHGGPDVQTVAAPTVPVLTHPATPEQCPNGGTVVVIGSAINVLCNGLNGDIGPSGGLGPIGPQGPIGLPGLNSTPFTFVQVCAGIAPQYPSTFPEYIMKLGNKDYGVYSANGGFWASLPPGAYSSDGINASCNFIINADGSISQ